MDLNILNPKKAVESAFKKPNLPLAMLLVLLPSLAAIASGLVFGVPFKMENAVFIIVFSFFSFFVLTLIIFALAVILKGRETKGKLVGFLSALSLMKIASLAIVLLSLIAIPATFSPAAMDAASTAANAGNIQIAAGIITAFVDENPDAINIPVFLAFTVIAVIIFIWGIYLVFLSIKKLSNTGWLGALALTIIAFIIMGVLPI